MLGKQGHAGKCSIYNEHTVMGMLYFVPFLCLKQMERKSSMICRSQSDVCSVVLFDAFGVFSSLSSFSLLISVCIKCVKDWKTAEKICDGGLVRPVSFQASEYELSHLFIFFL